MGSPMHRNDPNPNYDPSTLQMKTPSKNPNRYLSRPDKLNINSKFPMSNSGMKSPNGREDFDNIEEFKLDEAGNNMNRIPNGNQDQDYYLKYGDNGNSQEVEEKPKPGFESILEWKEEEKNKVRDV